MTINDTRDESHTQSNNAILFKVHKFKYIKNIIRSKKKKKNKLKSKE